MAFGSELFLTKILIVIALFFTCTYAWGKAAGSLSLVRLNLFSAMFYYVMILAFVGGSAVFCGYRDHYMIQKVSEEYIDIAYYILVWSIVFLPIVIWFFNGLMHVDNYRKFYDEYISSPVFLCDKKDNSVYVWCVGLTVIALTAVVYMFYVIGYIPLARLFFGGIDFARERIVAGREFAGNQYIRNFLALELVPLLSFCSYIYYRVTKQVKWQFLFCLHFVMAVLCKTYNFEKAPLALYLFFLCFVEILMGTKISMKKMLMIAGFSFCTIVGFYFLLAVDSSAEQIFDGIFKRIFFSQIGTLFLHIETFPNLNDFLYGASFPRSMGLLLGGDDWGIRSGRVVMEIFGAAGVAEGIAGVMNTLYIGEAWANYGLFGLIIGPVVVGIVVSVTSTFILKLRKDPVNIVLYIMLVTHFLQAIVGGFVDYIYSPSLIFDVIILMSMKLIVIDL